MDEELKNLIAGAKKQGANDNDIKKIIDMYVADIKKKEPSKPIAPKKQLESLAQPTQEPTLSATEEPQPQQVSGGLDGTPKTILDKSFDLNKDKTIHPKKETLEIVKDVIPKVSKAISFDKEDLSESTQRARRESKVLVDKKQIDKRVSEVNAIQNEYVKSLNEINSLKKQLSNEKSEIDYQISIGNNTPEFKEKIALHNKQVQDNLSKFDLLKDKSEIINYNKKVIESASGNLLRKKAEQGNWFGAIYNKMLEGASSISAGAASLATDLISEVIPSKYLISPKELQDLKDKGLDQNQIDDYIKKSAKKEVIPIIRKSNIELVGDKGTTEEYIKKKQASSLLGGGVLGLAESAPAMLGGVYGRAANFFIMGSDAVNKEMESNPEFKDITENEKLAVTIPIGIANAVLEEFGLQSVLKNNSLVNKLIHKTLLKVGADASANTFRKAMNNEVKDGIASGAFKLASGFTGEAITGGSQQAAEIGIKDIYNAVKEKKMFQTPETLSDAIYEISDAAIMEGIGGTIMSTLPAINEAIKNNDLGKKSTDFEFELLDNINENSEEFKKLFTADLKNKIIEGEIDKEEANSQLDSFDKMISTFNKMPKDMSVSDKKKSFDLLSEKEKLNNEISGKDESLSVRQKERISEINSELANISLGKSEAPNPKAEVVTEISRLDNYYKKVLEDEKSYDWEKEQANEYFNDKEKFIERDIEGSKRDLLENPESEFDKNIIERREKALKELETLKKEEVVKPITEKVVTEAVIPTEEAVKPEIISPETSSNYANLTEDKEGDFVFFHVGGKGYDKIKKSTGGTLATSKEEGAALGKVGGVAMYYTRPGDTESMVKGDAKYAVTIPKEKVYDANTDANNYTEEAKTRHEEEHPGKAFDSNTKLAYITKIAGENGYDMVVSEWMGKTRAQTTKEFVAKDVQLQEGNKIVKPFQEEYVSNTDLGYESIIPESKYGKFDSVYKKIREERNKENVYDDLYQLYGKDTTSIPQEDITKLVEESDLSQEVKDMYAEALAYEPGIRRTEVPFKPVTIENAPEGDFLNIGLNIGTTAELLDKNDVISMLPKGVKVLEEGIYDVPSEIDGKKNIERTLLVKLSRPLTKAEMTKLLEDTQQKAIPQLTGGKGLMYGSKEWGNFDPEYFHLPKNGKLADFISKKPAVEVKPTIKSKLAAFKTKYIEKPVINRTKLNSQVENAKKSLAKLLPDVKFVIHDTRESFIGVAGKNGRGYYDPSTKTIHINALEANARTVAHEVFHSVLLDKVKTDANARDLTKRMISAISKTLEGNPELKKNLDDFVKNYDENIQNEEKLAEIFGYLADGYEGFNAPTKTLIKKAMDRLAKMFGLKPFTEGEIVDMLRTLSGKVATGEEIVAKDVEIIKPAKTDNKGNLEKPSLKSKENLESKRYQIVKDTESSIRKGNTVSTRTPNIEGIHNTNENIVDLKSLEKDQALVIKIAKELSSYGLSKIENVENINDANKLIQDFKNSVKDNLKFLYDSFGKEVRDVAKLWYDGANKISNEIADKYGYSTDQVAGVMAVLSPQMDWFRNLSLGKRVIDIYKNNQESLFDSKMKDWVEKSTSGTGKNKKELFPNSKEIIKRVDGKKLSDLDIKDKAIFIRAYDEMYNSKNYENISPNGDINGLVRNSNGTPGACGWGAFSTIEKSISILENGSIENISKNLGNMHKVRNFFNNISDPSDPNAVTIDTHAVAAGLMLPLSGSSKEVLYNFGGASSKLTGSKGSYPIYADSYRELARELKILPRELQSITWEAVRGLFKADFKSNKSNEENVKKVWSKYKNGEISIDKAHSDISDLAGGISKPIWYEYLADDNVKSLDENSAAMDQANEDLEGRMQESDDYSDMKEIVKDMIDDGMSITEIKKIVTDELGPDSVSMAESAYNELTTVKKEPFKGKQKERSVLKRIKEGGNAEYINEIIDKIGINYTQRNQQQVIADAEAFVDEVGIEKAYEAIKNGSINNGDSVTVVYTSIIDRIPSIAENAIEDAKTESEKEAVKKEYNELLETIFDEFSKRQTDIGQATAILNALYIKNQEVMYSLSVQKEKYKAINAGVIDEETLKKFEALDKRYTAANKKIKELESKLKESVDEQNFKNIVEEYSRVTSKENIGSKARNLAKDIRSGKKAILPSWAVAEGAKGGKTQGVTFEKTFAKALETFADVHDATKDFAKAIEEGFKVIKQWYANNNIDFNEKDIKSKFSEYVNPKAKKLTVTKGVIKIPSEIISNYVANGGSDINELSEQILNDSKDEYPNLTVREIRDNISKYGSRLNKTRTQLAEDILRLKSLGRLESQLEDLKKGISKSKNEVKKRALSDLEKKYMAQIKAMKNALGITETERTTANENYIRRRIEQLKEKIKNNDFAKKEVTPIKESEELKKLKTEKNRVQEEYDKIIYTKELENRTVPEKITGFLSDMWDAQRVTRATGELSFVGAQGGFYMINSTFSRKTFNSLVKNFRGTSLSDWTKSPIKTISNIIRSATSAETIIEMFNKMGTKNNYDDYQALLKAHPYYDVFLKSKLRILSEDVKTQVRDEMFIGNHFLHILKLPFTALTKLEKGKKRITVQGYYERLKTGKVSEKNIKTTEEIFEAVNPLGVFERGNNTFMNMARVEMFMDGVQALEMQGKNPTDHLQDYKDLASAVNTVTGSGNLVKSVAMSLPILNKIFFSPRFWAASLNMTPPISLYYLAKLGNYDNVTLANPKSWGSIRPTVAQKAFVKPMLKGFIAFYGMSALVVSLINSALDDDDEMTEEEKIKKRAYIEYDPRSSNFMQVISGDTRTDFFGPYRNNMVLFSRLFTGQTSKDGNIIENGAKWGSRTDFQIGSEYIAGKANPFPGMFVRYSMGKKEEVLNEETNLKENRRMLFDDRVGIDYQTKENLIPIFVGTVKDIVDEDPVLGSAFYTTLALFGKQTSVYKKKVKSKISDEELKKLNPRAYEKIKALREKFNK